MLTGVLDGVFHLIFAEHADDDSLREKVLLFFAQKLSTVFVDSLNKETDDFILAQCKQVTFVSMPSFVSPYWRPIMCASVHLSKEIHFDHVLPTFYQELPNLTISGCSSTLFQSLFSDDCVSFRFW